MSMLVEPTVDQAPSMTAVLACSTASFKWKMRMPPASSWSYSACPAWNTRPLSDTPGSTTVTSTPRLAAATSASTVCWSGTK